KAGPAKSKGIKKGAKQAGKTQARKPLVHTETVPQSFRQEEPTWGRRLRWIALAAGPTSLMVALTALGCTNRSAITYFWIVPLMLYLLSFILVFARWPVVWTGAPHQVMLVAQPIAILGLCMILLTNKISVSAAVISILAFFLTALVCHGELARD